MADEGTFESLPNGDVNETGTMYNPKTDKYEPYIETWRRYKETPGAEYCVLERIGEGQAFLGRVGDRALGLAKAESEVYSAWRDELQESKWIRRFQISGQGIATLPQLPVHLPEEWSEGSQVQLGGHSWIVHTIGRL